MHNLAIAALVAAFLSPGSGAPMIRLPKGPTRRVYAEDRAAMAANRATAGERQCWNEAVDEAKEQKVCANLRTFIPRKASHKRGWLLDVKPPF